VATVQQQGLNLSQVEHAIRNAQLAQHNQKLCLLYAACRVAELQTYSSQSYAVHKEEQKQVHNRSSTLITVTYAVTYASTLWCVIQAGNSSNCCCMCKQTSAVVALPARYASLSGRQALHSRVPSALSFVFIDADFMLCKQSQQATACAEASCKTQDMNPTQHCLLPKNTM
jgi:hypothetical protein